MSTAFSISGPARRAVSPDSPRALYAAVGKPRAPALYRHAGGRPRAIISTSPRPAWSGCAARVTRSRFTTLEEGVARLRAALTCRKPTATAEVSGTSSWIATGCSIGRQPDRGYILRPEDFEWLPGSPWQALVRCTAPGAHQRRHQPVRGRTRSDDPEQLDRHASAHAGGGRRPWAPACCSLFCPHAPEAGCDCRKPAPGLTVRAAIAGSEVPAQHSLVVGDDLRDVEAATRAGVSAASGAHRQGPGHAAEERLRGMPAYDSLLQLAQAVVAVRLERWPQADHQDPDNMSEAATSEPERLLAVLDRFRAVRVWVVGDLMLDEYVMGAVERVSPEAPVPVVRVRDTELPPRRRCQRGAPGCRAGREGVSCRRLIGADAAGDDLLRLCEQSGIDTSRRGPPRGAPHHPQAARTRPQPAAAAPGLGGRAAVRTAERLCA